MLTIIHPRSLMLFGLFFGLSCGALGFFAPVALAKASFVQAPWPTDKPTPTIQLTDLQGKAWRSADLLGKVTVLNFWATWCEPCRDEMPSLARLAKSASDNPGSTLQVLTVNYQESEAKARRFMDAASLSLPVLLDPQGKAASAWTRKIFPTTVVIDQRGKARLTITGEFDWSSAQAQALLQPLLQPVIQPLLMEPNAGSPSKAVR